MSELAAKAVEKFKIISEALTELEGSENWYSRELKYLDERRKNSLVRDFEYYGMIYNVKSIVMNIILESLKQ